MERNRRLARIFRRSGILSDGLVPSCAAAAFCRFLWALYRLPPPSGGAGIQRALEERVDERTRIARELHDTLLQSFQGLMLRFQAGDDQLPPGKAKEALEKALERGDQAIPEGREAIQDLRSPRW